MNSNVMGAAAIFSINDLSEAYEYLDSWAVERSRLHPIDKGTSIVDTFGEPLFSKTELLLAFEATLDSMIIDALN